MEELNTEKYDFFWRNGYLLIQDVVSPNLISRLKNTFNNWVEESRKHTKNWGDTKDGRPRFDLEPGHNHIIPRLRRVNSPTEISETYYNVMMKSKIVDCIAYLIGPNIKFHHSKINAKQPGSTTEVKWHQDFSFTPHSNDSIVTALLMVDDVTINNGALKIVPGSHIGPIHQLWHNNTFTGTIDSAVAQNYSSKEIICVGPAGSVCLMHSRLLHRSATNTSKESRTLFILVYSTDDAIPLSRNPVPSRHEGILVRGKNTGRIRSTSFEIDLPQFPTTASFFDQQK